MPTEATPTQTPETVEPAEYKPPRPKPDPCPCSDHLLRMERKLDKLLEALGVDYEESKEDVIQ